MLEHHPHYPLRVVDKLTYAGNLRNLDGALCDPRLCFHRMDICNPAVSEIVEGCDAVINFAAESHVDRSIEDASAFVHTNIEGTWHVIQACRLAHVGRFIQVSTDEVYGSADPKGQFLETSPLAPNSPYAATKASADLIVLAHARTYGFPGIITRCSNNYGPNQFPEKFIPLAIAQALANQPIPVYGDGQNVRDWIHVYDHCRALDLILHHGKDGEIYNIGGESELRNVEVAKRILAALGCPESLIQFVSDRPGHDRRYALDCGKLKNELGWQPQWNFDRGLASTIYWYQENSQWLEETRSGEYRAYFERHYLRREATLEAIS